MQTRVDGDERALGAALLPAVHYAGLPEVEVEAPALPADHPAWARDAVALSMRARALLAHVKPAVVRVLTYWDHAVRSILVGGRRLGVDGSGSYRID